MKKLLTTLMLIAAVTCLSVFALADKPDNPNGAPKTADRVIFLTDHNGDGFFERSPALVADDTNATARISPGAQPFGQPVNLWVYPSEESILAGGPDQPFLVRRVLRGRFINHYEALITTNH